MTVTTETVLPAQLAAIKEDLAVAHQRLRGLCQGLDGRSWTLRPAAGGWSIAECVTHLNITSEQYIPLLDEAIRSGRQQGIEGQGPFRRGVIGWVLLRYMEPPYRMKAKTPLAFQPTRVAPMAGTLDRFAYLQQEVQARVDRSAGLALDRLRVVSPFNARITYNVYVAFALLAAHQRRHLWQAEQVRLTD